MALVVFLENVGHIHGLNLPAIVKNAIDFTTEEYAKALLRVYGAYRRYDRVIILEDEHATGHALATTLLSASRTHRLDLLLLVHGLDGQLIGYKGLERVGAETFERLRAHKERNPHALDLRMVYGVNCYGASLAGTWLELGAEVTNGAVGVNWFPEPSLSIFLRRWLGGRPYSEAVQASNLQANRVWRRLLKSRPGHIHPWILTSRQIVFGNADINIFN